MTKKEKIKVNIDINRLGIVDKLDEVNSLVYKILNLDDVDLNDWTHIPFINDMKLNKEDPFYHPEGNTLAHTSMVMDEVMKLFKGKEINRKEAEILRLAAFFHDVGKPEVSIESDNRVRSSGHDLVSFQKAKYILDRLYVDFEVKIKVLSIIRNHLAPGAFVKQEVGFRAYERLSWKVDTRLLYLFATCDYKGREKDVIEALKQLENFKTDCIKWFVWGKTYKRNKFYNPLKAYLLIGCSGSGKSTYANILEEKGAVVISSDDIRKELCGNEEDQSKNKEVFDLIHKRIRYYGDNRVKKIVIDSTNYSKRNQILTILRSSGYNVEIIYFDIPYFKCIERNNKRERVVPESVIKRQYEQLIYPNYSEADVIKVVFEHCIKKFPHVAAFKLRKYN